MATWVQDNSAFSSASSTTITVSLTGVTAGNLITVAVRFEGASTSITVSDGTTTFTADTAQAYSGDTYTMQFHYLLASVASGSVTYTATFGAARTYRAIAVMEHSYTGTLSFDTSNRGQGNSTSLSSGNITTTGTDEVVIGAGSSYFSGVSFSSEQINSVAADHTEAPGFLEMWDRAVGATFTGAATATSSPSSIWMGHVIAFKATSASAPAPSVNDSVTLAESVDMRMHLANTASNDSVTVAEAQTMHMPIHLRMEKLS